MACGAATLAVSSPAGAVICTLFFFHFLLGHPLCVVRGDSVWTPRHDLCKRLCVAVLTSLLCSACGTVLLSVFLSSLYLPFQK